MYDIKLLPARLKQARNYRGLSKEECAGLFGIHPNSYLRWENGAAVLNARQLAQLAEHVQIDLNYFFDSNLSLEQADLNTTGAEQPRLSPETRAFLQELETLGSELEARVIEQCRPILKQALDYASQQQDMARIPFYGQIAGGQPLLIEDYLGETVEVPRNILIGRDHYFAVRVMGDSMEGAGIHHQDVIILRAQNTAENGQIAAVNYHGEATLKRIYIRGDIVELHPCNPSHQVISLPARDVKIQGLFIKVLDMAASA